MKTCSKCKKDGKDFNKGPGWDGKSAWCKDCFREYKKSDKYKAQQKLYLTRYNKTSDRIEYMKIHNRNNGLQRFYGITLEEYNKIFSNQNGCCAGCNKHQSEFKKSLAVDHDHLCGEIRGLLCQSCNMALGMLKDNPEILENLKIYLNRSKVRMVD